MSEDERLDRIENHFDEEAAEYDSYIEDIIPGYARQNEILLGALSLPSGPSRVADLGIGTGQLSDLVLERYPDALVTGYDFSQAMLDKAAENLGRFDERVSFVYSDIGGTDLFGTAPERGYDAIIAGLSVHHLDDTGKQALFARVFDVVAPGGLFVIRDVVLGDTDEETERMEQGWREFIRSNGLDDEQVLAAHHAEDAPSPLTSQLEWLAEAGFSDVEVVWQEMMFAIFCGSKPGV